MDDKEPFVARWSRRKLEAKENAPAAAPVLAPPDTAPAVPTGPAAQAAAPGSAQGRGPEYREFFDPQVDEKLRQAALREMFGDPHFNVMDGLDTYIDDYSKPDPIPAAMLRQLNQAKGLLLFEDEQPAGSGDAAPAALGRAGSESAGLPQPAAESVSSLGAAESAGAVAATPAVDSRKN